MESRKQAGRLTRILRGATDRCDQRGASLIEIVVATLILSIVAIGMVEFFASGHVGFDQEERKRVGTLLAQEAMERTVAQGYDLIANWSENRTIGNVDYTVRVVTQTSVPESNLKTVDCDVFWSSTPTSVRSVSLSTLVFNN